MDHLSLFQCDGELSKNLEDVMHKNLFSPICATILVLRGLPGSGKSTIAHHLCAIAPRVGFQSAHICSADNYFVDSNKLFVFDPTKLNDAHEYCCKLAQTTLVTKQTNIEQFSNLVIIDNTNIEKWNYAYYEELASSTNSLFRILEVWPRVARNLSNDEFIRWLFLNNRHSVPLVTLTRMFYKWEVDARVGIVNTVNFPPRAIQNNSINESVRTSSSKTNFSYYAYSYHPPTPTYEDQCTTFRNIPLTIPLLLCHDASAVVALLVNHHLFGKPVGTQRRVFKKPSAKVDKNLKQHTGGLIKGEDASLPVAFCPEALLLAMSRNWAAIDDGASCPPPSLEQSLVEFLDQELSLTFADGDEVDVHSGDAEEPAFTNTKRRNENEETGTVKKSRLSSTVSRLSPSLTTKPPYVFISHNGLNSNSNLVRLAVFIDQWRKGYYVSSGSRYASAFVVYHGSPLLYHAFASIKIIDSKPQSMTPLPDNSETSSAGITLRDQVSFSRLQQGVVKLAVLVWLDGKPTGKNTKDDHLASLINPIEQLNFKLNLEGDSPEIPVRDFGEYSSVAVAAALNLIPYLRYASSSSHRDHMATSTAHLKLQQLNDTTKPSKSDILDDRVNAVLTRPPILCPGLVTQLVEGFPQLEALKTRYRREHWQ